MPDVKTFQSGAKTRIFISDTTSCVNRPGLPEQGLLGTRKIEHRLTEPPDSVFVDAILKKRQSATNTPMVSVDTPEPPLLISGPFTASWGIGAATLTFLASETGS
jgi:hypothetical protein